MPELLRARQYARSASLVSRSQTYLGQTRESSFGNWIVVSANAPLLAMLAGSWSCLSERLSGYEAQICTRVSRNAYVNVKMLSAFLSAFAVTAIPLLVNFLIVSMLFPAYLPRVDESTYVGLYLHSYFSGLFLFPASVIRAGLYAVRCGGAGGSIHGRDRSVGCVSQQNQGDGRSISDYGCMALC